MGNLYSIVAEEARNFKEMSNPVTVTSASNGEAQTPTTPSPNNEQLKNPKLLGALGPLMDPRSPTQGVSRTPLELEEKAKRIEKSRIMNQLNKENNQEGETEPVTTPPNNKDLLAVFDPRSPNQEINRTPIVTANNGPIARKMFQSSNDQ